VTPTITPFCGTRSKAAKFYTSIFKYSKIKTIARYRDTGPGPKGSVMTVAFEMEGQEFVPLNGGPLFRFTPRFHSSSTATPSKKCTVYGTSCLPEARPTAAGG
jgi:predicted 3-demethylubiquinone-9 3-methyltransferase (glyoxalase superfamily)